VRGQVVKGEDASKQDEHNPQLTRPRDHNQSGGSKRPRDVALSADEAEGEVDVAVVPDEESSATAANSAATPDVAKAESSPVTLPPFKKKRLPPIRKNKLGTAPSTSGASGQSATGKPPPKPLEPKGGSGLAPEATVDPLSALKRPKRVNKQQEVNLNDKSVYEALFKHVRSLSCGPCLEIPMQLARSLAALPHVLVSTRKKRKSDGESWTECERRIVHDEQRLL
jgi:hypothetical protein